MTQQALRLLPDGRELGDASIRRCCQFRHPFHRQLLRLASAAVLKARSVEPIGPRARPGTVYISTCVRCSYVAGGLPATLSPPACAARRAHAARLKARTRARDRCGRTRGVAQCQAIVCALRESYVFLFLVPPLLVPSHLFCACSGRLVDEATASARTGSRHPHVVYTPSCHRSR